MNRKQKIKRAIASVLVLLISFNVKAAECEIGGIVFDYEYEIKYDKEGSHSYILLSASVKVKDGKSLIGAVVIPPYITVDDGVQLMVTTIGASAFEGNTSITKVSIPGGVSHIYGSAFKGCTALEDVIVGTPIQGMPSEGLTCIENNAFENCTSLKCINLPNSLTKIGDKAFQHCEALMTIDLLKGIKEIGQYAFNSCYNMKSIKFPSEGFTKMGYSCFSHCTSLESITIPGCVRSIDHYCFKGCTGLKNAVLELGEKSFLGDYLFDGCTNLVQATISSYNTLGSNSFRGCTNLKTVVLNNMTKIGPSLFENCTSLESVSIPNVTTINSEAFLGCSSLKHIAIPEGVTTLPKSVFEGCSSLESISLPSTITEIGNRSLWGCSSLTKLDLPSKLKTVRNSAFVSCMNISTLIFPATLTTLEPNVFYGCKGLKLIDLRLAQVKITNTSRDPNNSNLVFRDVPESTLILMPGETFSISDPEVLRICLENWDSNKDGELSAEECMAVTDLNNVFKNNKTIKTFNELKYFTGLKSIKYGDFDGCTNLESITLPASLEEIGEAPFGNCNALKSIIIPASVTKIGTANIGTFLWNLGSIKVEEGNTVYDSRYDCNAIIEKASGKLIVGCQSTVIPNDVTTIAAWAFNTCLEKPIKIPEGVTTIEKNAFLGNHFKTIVLPSSLTSMTWAFHDSSLKMVESRIMNPFALDELTFNMAENAVLYVPQGTKELYEGTEGWNKFAAIIEVEQETSENVINFEDEKVKQLCLENWDLNNSGEISFKEAEGILKTELVFYISGITSFKELQYFTRLKSIGEYAFRESGLTDVVLPQSVESIEHGAFLGCKMTDIEIPASVTSIGENAFLRCKKLESVRVNWKEPIVLDEKAFPTRTNVILYVPIGTKKSYLAVGYWKEFKDIQETYVESSGVYVIDDKNEATITGGNSGLHEKEVVIPQSIIIDGENYAITAIGENAFANNTVMTQVTIPASITGIGDGAFAGCTSLEAIYCYADDPIVLGSAKVAAQTRAGEEEMIASSVFADVNKETCVLYVPSGCKKKYAESSGWNEFQTIKEFGGTAIKCGDANSDGKINVADIVEIVNNGKGNPSENFNEANADVNADGSVDKDDLELITNYLMNLAPKTLYELKAMIHMGIDFSIYQGYYVDGSGNISASDVNAVGRICYISNIDVDEAVPGSRILVLGNTDITAQKGVTWGVYGEYMHLNDVKALCGYSNTLTLQAYGHGRDIRYAGETKVEYETGYPAACYAWNYDGEKPIGASHWFLPSYAQWNLISTIARTSGTGQLTSGKSYWTSTDNSGNLAFHYSLGGRGDNPKDYFIYNDDYNKDWSQFCVRACYAY